VQSDGRHALLAGLAASEALEALARQSGFSVKSVQTPTPPQDLATAGKGCARAVAGGGGWLPRSGGGTSGSSLCGGQIADLQRRSSSPLTRRRRTTLCLTGGGRRVLLFAPDLTLHRLQPQVVRAVLCQELEAPVAAEVAHLLKEAGVPWHVRRDADAILRERLSSACWLAAPTTQRHLAFAPRVYHTVLLLVGARTLFSTFCGSPGG